MKKHISKDFWLVKALAGAALVGFAFFYLSDVRIEDVVAMVGLA